MTIEEQLLEEVDKITAALNTSQSAFIRDALQMALRRYSIAALEQQHAQGYANLPLESEELDEWTEEQFWGRT